MTGRPWEPEPTHWHLPVPVQAIRYTGENWAEVINWARHRGAQARQARYVNYRREHRPLLVTCWWPRSGNYAEGAVEAGDWLVLTFGESGHVQGWSAEAFAGEYGDTPPAPPERRSPRTGGAREGGGAGFEPARDPAPAQAVHRPSAGPGTARSRRVQ